MSRVWQEAVLCLAVCLEADALRTSHSLCASGETPFGGAAAGVKRSAVMYVAAVMTCSSLRSPRMLAIIADTFSPVLICSTARYLSTPQRATHSSSSSKSSETSSTAEPLSFCELTKAALH